MRRWALIFSTLVFLSSCTSSAYTVNYHVIPAGAQLFVDAKNGSKPFEQYVPSPKMYTQRPGQYNRYSGFVEAHYGNNPEEVLQYTDEKGCYRVATVSAKWMSGATVAVQPRLCNGPGTYDITLERHRGTGYEKDVAYLQEIKDRLIRAFQTFMALQVESDKAKAAKEANAWYNNLPKTFSSDKRVRANCTSTVSGNNIYTSCN